MKPLVLDACGSRMFWFDRRDSRAIYVDKRRETHTLPDKSSAGGSRQLIVDPDLQADFTALPFEDGRFALVVFDPPHLVRAGKRGWLAKKYGKLKGDWRDELRRGFLECFRVLQPEGTLILKWNEHEVPVSQILALTDARPLFGNRCGKAAKSHWIVFMKPGREETANDSSSETAEGGSGLAQPVPNGGAQKNQPESEDAPDAEAQAVTDRSRPERFSAAPLLGVFSLRRECEKKSEKSIDLALDA